MAISWLIWFFIYFLQILTSSIYGSVSYDGSINISKVYSTCSKGWFEYGDLCYKVGGTDIKGGVTWETATKACDKENGHLATVYDQDITDFLSAFLIMPAKSFFWIGLDDRVREGVYKWADGTPFNFTNYRPHEPNLKFSDGEDCTEMDYRTMKEEAKMGQWNDLNCNSKLPYICQKEKEIEVDPRSMVRKTVHHLDPRYCETDKGLGWRFEESCFYVVPEKRNWTQAEAHCAKEYKGHLATLDFRVNYFINYVFWEVTVEMWIGVKIQAETQQKWSSGWLVTFENWAEQEKYVDGTCVSRDASGAWLIQPCEKELRFICEHSTSKAMPPVLNSSVENAHCPKIPQGSHGWRDIGGDFCYFFDIEASVPWHEASYNCLKRGGTLAIFHSQAEYDVVSLFVWYYRHYRFYIGFYRPTKDANEFVWLDGSPVNFTSWRPGEPNNWNREEQCTELNPIDMTWNDGACSARMGYICSTQKIAFASNCTQTFLADGSNITTMEILLKEKRRNTIAIYALLGAFACLVVVVLFRGKLCTRNT